MGALQTYWRDHLPNGMRFSLPLFKNFLINPWAPTATLENPFWSTVYIVAAVFGLFCIGVGFRDLWRQRRPHRSILWSVALFSGIYFLIHLFWHVTQPRYAIPLLPFILIFLVHGANF